MQKYVKLVENLLSEVKIDKTSLIRKKFVVMVKKNFLGNDNLFVTEDDTLEIGSDDVKAFFKYKLLDKQPEGIKVTNKGIACAMGVDVNSNEDDSNYSVDTLKAYAEKIFAPNDLDKFKKWIIATSSGIIKAENV